MANDFTKDESCVALWSMEDGALTADSIGGNTLMNSGVTAETGDYKEKAACGEFENDTPTYMYAADGDLDDDFPFSAGSGSHQMTVCAWIKPESEPLGYNHRICGKMYYCPSGNYPDNCFNLGWYGSGVGMRLYLVNYYDTVWNDYDIIQGSVAGSGIGVWLHVALCLDREANTYKLRVWRSDTETAYEDSGSLPNECLNNDYNANARWLVGAHPGSTIGSISASSCWDGRIDELVVFNRILTFGEIDQIRAGNFPTCMLSGTISAKSKVTGSLTSLDWTPLHWRASWPLRERLQWKTQVIRGGTGSEQRFGYRKFPRQLLHAAVFLADDAEVREFDGQLHRFAKRHWAVPVWPERTEATEPVAAGSGSVACDTRYADFRNSSWAMLWQKQQNELVKVNTVADDGLTLSYSTKNGYGGRTLVMPVRRCILLDEAVARRHVGQGAMVVEMDLEVLDNQLVTGHAPLLTYDGLEVLTVPSVCDGSWRYRHHGDAKRLDSGVGAVDIVPDTTFNISTQDHEWLRRTKQQCWELRQFLHDLRGKQKSVLVPTFRRDFTLTRAAGASDTSVYVAAAGFAANYGANAMRCYLAFRPAGALPVPRKVTAISAVSAAEEKVDIDAAPGQAFPVGSHLCWVDQVRLNHDEVELEWLMPAKLRCRANWRRVEQ